MMVSSFDWIASNIGKEVIELFKCKFNFSMNFIA